MTGNPKRLTAWMLIVGFMASAGLCVLAQSAATKIESTDTQRSVLQELLVGVSDARFFLYPDTAETPYVTSLQTSLGWTSWLTITDEAIAGFAYLQSAMDASCIALVENLENTLARVGDLAADILGSLPLIMEIEAGDMFSGLHTVGWITFDEESLRTARVPDIQRADDVTRKLDAYADDMAREIGLAIRAEDGRYVFWSRGYLPGIGIYFHFDLDYGCFLPAELNTMAKWQDRLTRIFEKLGVDALSAMTKEESVIVCVDGLAGQDRTFFVIDREDLLNPSVWEIAYW